MAELAAVPAVGQGDGATVAAPWVAPVLVGGLHPDELDSVFGVGADAEDAGAERVANSRVKLFKSETTI